MTKYEEHLLNECLKRMGKIPTPTCVFCFKKVESINASYSLPLASLMLTIKCHGDTQIIQIPEDVLVKHDDFSFSTAFDYGVREDGVMKHKVH
jgi:hypothetical protein